MRPAVASDAAAVAAVWLRSRHASVPSIPEPVHSDDAVRRWVADVLVPGGGTWVLDGAGGVVAMLALRPGWIEHLYVDPGHVGQGLGGQLVEHAKSLSPAGLDLWTFQSNARARAFYERHGFVAVEETTGDNEERSPDVRYRWHGSDADSAHGSPPDSSARPSG